MAEEGVSNPDDLPEYSEDGVDLTLIRWMHSLTPAERLQVLQDSIDCIEDIRAAQTQTQLK